MALFYFILFFLKSEGKDLEDQLMEFKGISLELVEQAHIGQLETVCDPPLRCLSARKNIGGD
jgi:hypothetical protein